MTVPFRPAGSRINHRQNNIQPTGKMTLPVILYHRTLRVHPHRDIDERRIPGGKKPITQNKTASTIHTAYEGLSGP